MQSTGRNPEPTLAPLAVRVEQAAELLGVSRAHVFRMIARGELRTVKSGARRLVPVRAVEEWLERQSA
jgi:excisionase family DNA binding protein